MLSCARSCEGQVLDISQLGLRPLHACALGSERKRLTRGERCLREAILLPCCLTQALFYEHLFRSPTELHDFAVSQIRTLAVACQRRQTRTAEPVFDVRHFLARSHFDHFGLRRLCSFDEVLKILDGPFLELL